MLRCVLVDVVGFDDSLSVGLGVNLLVLICLLVYVVGFDITTVND